MGYLTDASYKQAQAEVYGQLTTSAVATGSQLVAFSGFSNSNYVREAYSADLDFGTGEWSASAWVNVPVTLPVDSFPVGSEMFSDFAVEGSWTDNGNGSWSITNAATPTDLRIDYPGSVVGKTHRVSFTVSGVSGTAPIVYSLFSSPGSYGNGTQTFIVEANVSYFIVRAAAGTTATVSAISIKEAGSARIADRAHSTGAAVSVGVLANGKLTATAYDGTTTRTVTTDAAYNTGTWLKVRANYQAGKLAILVNGVEVKSTVGAPLLSLNSRYNSMTYSDDLSNAVWIKRAATASANLITATASTGDHSVLQSVAGISGTITGTVDIKAGTSSFAWICLSPAYGLGNYATAVVDLTAGTVSKTQMNGTVSITASSISTADADGYRRLTLTVSSPASGMTMIVGICASGTPTITTYGAVDLTTTGTETILVRKTQLETGSTAKTYQRVGAATDFDFKAPLTIGNNYAANAPFPGSIALLKFSATVPSTEQSIWMYEQEKQMFRGGAQVALPDANAIQDLAYDDLTDRWIAVSSTNKSTWSGLVRTASEAVPAGSYTKVSAASGIQLAARSTTNPGVDITIPAYNVKARAKKKAEKSKKLTNATAIYDFTPVVFSNATLTNGSNVMTVTTANTTGTPYIGMGITGTGIAAGTMIVGIVSGTPNSYYLSAAYTGTTGSTYTVGQSTFSLPVGYTARLVYSGGLIQREGSTKAFTRTFDGFRETIVFGTSPGTSVVQIHATKQ